MEELKKKTSHLDQNVRLAKRYIARLASDINRIDRNVIGKILVILNSSSSSSLLLLLLLLLSCGGGDGRVASIGTLPI